MAQARTTNNGIKLRTPTQTASRFKRRRNGTLSQHPLPPLHPLEVCHQPPVPSQASGGRWVCRKQGGVHPEFYEDAKVYCNGELVMTTGGTQREYAVGVWSGNHPFYLGNRSALVVEDDQVEKFRKKYGELSSLMQIPVLKHGEIVLPQRKKSAKGKGKK